MARSRKLLTVGALGAAAVALVASTTVTGAYFSESKAGGITGTIGAVHLDAAPTTFTWTNMMPGEKKSATVDFTNTGTGPQDFYLVFKNGPALHALNNLGKYGEVHVAGGPTANVVPVFNSFNLQDGRTRADGSNSCSSIFVEANLGCWPLPESLLVASDLAPTKTGSLTFTFNYAGKLGNASQGGVFNSYPSIGAGGEAFGDDLLGTAGAGLPFDVVAVQAGKTP